MGRHGPGFYRIGPPEEGTWPTIHVRSDSPAPDRDHGMPGITCAATAVVTGQVAPRALTIQMGAGGNMLPDHATLALPRGDGTLSL